MKRSLLGLIAIVLILSMPANVKAESNDTILGNANDLSLIHI